MEKTAYDMEKYLAMVYDEMGEANGTCIDSVRLIDDSILKIVDEVNFLIREFGGNSKNIPYDYLVRAINENGYFDTQVKNMIRNYDDIRKSVKFMLILLNDLQEMVKQ